MLSKPVLATPSARMVLTRPPLQQETYHDHPLAPASPHHSVSGYNSFKGPVDVNVLQQAASLSDVSRLQSRWLAEVTCGWFVNQVHIKRFNDIDYQITLDLRAAAPA